MQDDAAALSLETLAGCELHAHTGGCFYVDELLDLVRAAIHSSACPIDWSLFEQSYKKAFGQAINIAEFFGNLPNDSVKAAKILRPIYVIDQNDAGDFNKFQAKFNLLICILRHRRVQMELGLNDFVRVLDRFKYQGHDYVELRCMSNPDDINCPKAFIDFHACHAQLIKDACDENTQFRYIISLPRDNAIRGYQLVQQLFDQHQDLVAYIVGLDFCFYEQGHPPKKIVPMMKQLAKDNTHQPKRALEVVYHVAESFDDKTLESAIRWCHEAAMLGAKRLGHAVALGLDPQVAISRHLHAHEKELVCERLDQVAYDLKHAAALNMFGVQTDEPELEVERLELLARDPQGTVFSHYDKNRLDQIRKRQNYVLDALTQMGTVIESCPTSNRLIGGVLTASDHPLHRFLVSKINLVISTDDPGIFDTTLEKELAWAIEHCNLDQTQLLTRLGDPRRFRLGQSRL